MDPVFITDKGIKLYVDNQMVILLNREIERLGLEKVQVFLAVHPNDYKEYLLVENTKPCFSSQKIEDIESYVQMMALDKNFK